MKLGGLDHAAWRSADLERCLKFYHDVLGAEVLSQDRNAAWVKIGEMVVEVFPPITEAPEPPRDVQRGYHHLAVRLLEGDLQELSMRLQAAGARDIQGPLQTAGGSESIFFYDPDGNRMQLVRRP